MIHTLKTDCCPGNRHRPLKLDLRGISLDNTDLSGLDLSGYEFQVQSRWNKIIYLFFLCDHEALGPVRLVAILREDDDNSGMDEMIAEARQTYGVSEEKMRAIIEPGFEKAKELARLIL